MVLFKHQIIIYLSLFLPYIDRWSSVAVTGQAPSPCSSFTLTKVGEKRAAMFGGWSGSDTSNDLLFVELGRYYVVSMHIN